MEAQAHALPVTFNAVKAANFQGFTPELRKDVEYLEQLALQTNTDISEWPVFDMLKDVAPGNKRAINKIFFAKLDEKPATEIEQELEKLKASEAMLNQAMEALRASLLGDYRYNRDYYLQQAAEYYRNYQNKLKDAGKQHDMLLLLESGGQIPITSELQKILKKGFFKLHAVTGSSVVELATRNNIIMRERNPALGVDRRVDLGKYKFRLALMERNLTGRVFEKNLNAIGAIHPYISGSGAICWGNGSQQASDLMAKGEWDKTFDLLASLLTNYSTDSTPYATLRDFEVAYQRQNPPNGQQIQLCSECVLPESDCSCRREEEPRCNLCEEPEDDCECSYCEACDIRYRSDDTCDGYFCQTCEACTGNSRCEDHWCSICATYDAPDCGCCHTCSRVADDCTCCPDCASAENMEHYNWCPTRSQTPETETTNSSQTQTETT